MTSRRWCFTLNNWTPDEHQFILDKISNTMADSVRYAIVGKEVGESGTPHLQGYLNLRKPCRLKGLKTNYVGNRAHCKPAEGTDLHNQVYCSKEGDFEEVGTPQSQGTRNDITSAIDSLKSGATLSDVAENHSEVFVKYGRGLRDLQLMLDKPYNHDSVRGLWIYGPPGTGKSHHARLINPNSTYLKPQNKWFDGYSGQEIILLDDLDTGMLGHYLKIWADKYACTGETKGGTVNLRHKQFVVTSNYSIEYFFPEDPEMASAVKRRFKEIHMTGLVEHLDMINNPNGN